MINNQLSLLKTRRFLPLFITQFLGAFNDNTFKNALVILITYRIAEKAGFNPQILVTLAAGIFILPFFLFSATAGQLADKFEKSRLITIIKLIEIFIMLAAIAGFYFQQIYVLLFVLFSLGTHATFFGPLKYAILPEHLQETELIAGNGLIEAGTFISILVGTILGGVLILQPHGEFIISSLILFMATMGLLASLFIPKTLKANPDLTIRFNIFKETGNLLKYSKKQWDIFLSILGISWFWLVGATFLAEFPVFAKDSLHANENVVTFFLTLFSIGLALGSLLCNKLLKGKVQATYAPLGALGITLFTIDLYYAAIHVSTLHHPELMTFSQFLQTFAGWRIAFDLLFIAISGGLYTVPLYAILQQRSDKAHRARVIASNNVVNALFMVVAAIATMLMLKLGFSVHQVFLAVAIGNGLVALYICKLLPDIFIKSFFRWLLTTLYRVKINGIEHYHAAGERLIIIANHSSFIDALLLATFFPDKLTFAVNTFTAKKWWIRLFLRMVDAYPLDPTNPMAIKSLISFMQQNKRCVIFPEGRLTMTGALMKIYEGPGLIADKSKAKLLPIRIQGAQFTPFSRLRGKVRIRWMPKITITISAPQNLEVSPEIKGRKRRQIIGLKLYDVMTNMLFETSDSQKTLFTSLLDARAMHGRNHKIVEDIEREPCSYQQFITRSFILANLIAKSTAPCERVGILLPNMISTVLTFFAMQACGRVPAMLNYSSGIRAVLTTCKLGELKIIYTSRKFETVAKLTDLLQTLKNNGFSVIYLEDLRAEITWATKLKGILQGFFPRFAYQRHNISPDSPAVLLFTSGSEGSPKGVLLSHTNLQANRFQISACVDFTASDHVFNALPIFHSFGLTGGMLLPILSGVKVFFYPSPLHYRIIPELAYDSNATILFGTDTFLARYARFAHPYDFYSLRYVFAGAEKLREETRTVWAEKFGVRIFEGYGATETAPVIAMNTPMQHKVGTVGRILPGLSYKILPVPGITEGGILALSGPNVMQGYLSPSGQVTPLTDGWYETGDIVAIDETGFITIQGRVKRFAKIAGEMISLGMVEQHIETLWPGNLHAVIQMPDAKKGEQLILITTYLHAQREELISYIRTQQLSELCIPKKIIVLKEMPLLATGKIDYVSLKNLESLQNVQASQSFVIP